MSDLIDRQQAIEAICMETCGVSLRNERCMVHCTEVQTVEKLPPAPSANNSEFPNSSDTISRAKAIEALKNDMASLDHIIKGMSANDVRLDAYVSQRNQVNYDIYAIKQLPPAQPAQHTPDQNGDLWITVPDIDKVTRIFVQESKSKFCRIFYEER